MNHKIFYYYCFTLLICQIVASLNRCPKGMELYSISEPKRAVPEKFMYYELGNKTEINEVYINLNLKLKDLSYASLIISKDIPKKDSKKNPLVFNFYSKKGEKGIFVQIQKFIHETYSENEDDVIQIAPSENSITMNFDIYIGKKEIKILDDQKVVYSKKNNIENLLDNYTYIHSVESSKDKNQKVIQDFTVCYLENDSNLLRKLEENEESKLDYFEIDDYCIKTSPSILRDGNVHVIPSMRLHPKNKNGTFPSDILSYSLSELKSLFTLSHSKNITFYYDAVIFDNRMIVINIKTKIPGEIYITSQYFKYNEKYIINVANALLDTSEIYVSLNGSAFIRGEKSTIKIIPMDKYQNQIFYLDESDIQKFELNITLSNNTVIKAEQALFDLKEKAIIFNVILNYIGKAFIGVKYEDTDISCNNCTIYINTNEGWENMTNIYYSDKIMLGEISNLTISLKEEYTKEISIQKIFELLEIKCYFEDKEYEVISELNEESNTIKLYNKELITSPGNITWQFVSSEKELNYKVSILSEAIITNLKFNIISDSLNEEIKENNTKITLDVKSDFILIYELVDLYYHQLPLNDSANVNEVQLFGNDMIPILFDIQREGNKFNISIPENKKEDFHYLVSGSNYELTIKVEKNDTINLFYFNINLTSPENDTGYGNGPYNISHFTFEPNINIYEMTVGDKFIFYLNIRTEKDLLYHKDLDINEHFKFNQDFEDDTFSFNITKINSTLSIFLIELFTTKSNDNLELNMTFDGEKLEKNIIIQPLPFPNLNYTEIVNYTNHIYNDIEPINIYIILKDNYLNRISKKDITYKKQLVATIGNKTIEQNLNLIKENKTYIISFVSDYQGSSLNINLFYNNLNDLILLKSDLTVELHVTKFLEPEPIITQIAYKTGIAFLYQNIKLVNMSIQLEDLDDDHKEDIQTTGDFLLYIREKNYEQTENDTKVVLFSGYLAILQLKYRNSTSGEDIIDIYDKKLLSIYNNMRNNSENQRIYNINNTINLSSGFVKLEFYETGEIKQMYYPKTDSFIFRSIEYIRETAALIIPKISSDLFSDDIQDKFNELQKDIKANYSTTEKKNSILRRLSEPDSKKRKKINRNKIKKRVFRILQEETGEETYVEDEILPTENDLDIQFREIKTNEDNSSNLTLLSIGDVKSDTAKFTGSLDNKTVLTNINEDGKVSEIHQKQNTQFVSGIKDESLNDYISNKTYDEDSAFEKDLFEAENETEMLDETSPMNIKGLESDNVNSVKLLDDFTDDNGTIIEHFDSFEFEEFNDTVYDNYTLKAMGNDYLKDINGSNMTVEITDEFTEDNNELRHLGSSDYPYYGQSVVSQSKNLYEKSFAGISMLTYVVTKTYPHNGIIESTTMSVFGSIQKTLSSQTTYSNNHIIIKNKNTMTNDLSCFLKDKEKEANNYKTNSEFQLRILYPPELRMAKPYSYETLFDDYYNGLIDKLNKQDETINNTYPTIYQYILNSKDNVETICNDNENKIKDYLNQIFNENINKINNYVNLGKKFNADVLNLIKQNYSNEEASLLQKVSDDINIFNNEINKNITKYLTNYSSKISNELDINKFEEDSILKSEYKSEIDNIMKNLNDVEFVTYEHNKKVKNIKEMLQEEIEFNKKTINNFYSNIKELKTQFLLNGEMFSSVNNSLSYYIEEHKYTEDEDEKINNLKNYLTPIYNNLHKFFFNFYKELSEDIFYKLEDIKFDKSKLKDIKEQLFKIIKNITEEYNFTVAGEDDTHKKQINEDFNVYNQIIKNYSNLNVSEIVSNYDLSDELWNKFNNSLQEIIDSFNIIEQNKNLILEYPEELDYIINTLESFNNDFETFFEDINNYTNNILTQKILPLYNKTNLKYIEMNHDWNIQYLLNNIRQTNDYKFNAFKDESQSYLIGYKQSIAEYENLENFKIINESTINRFKSILEEGYNKIKTKKTSIYDYFTQTNNNQTNNNQTNNNQTNRAKYQNNLMRARLEMMMSYINLFAINLNETFNENDFNNLFINNSDYEGLENNSYQMEIDINDEIINNYAQSYSDDTNFVEQLKENVDISTLIDDNYRAVGFEDFNTYYIKIINLEDELFVNNTKNYFENYNDSIYSLLSQYKSILYQYVEGYNYDIISFDVFENYFNNLTETLANKFELIKNKTQTLNDLVYDNISNSYYYYFGKFFADNISSYLDERDKNFIDELKLNKVNFQKKILDYDFNLSDFILYESVERYGINPYQITDVSISTLSDEISNYILELENPIKNVFKNITDEFLINFQKGVNITDKDRKNLIDTYKNFFKLPSNNTFDRKCWNYRGIFFNDIVKEDLINYNNYLEYLAKKKNLEECEANETMVCMYDNSSLEEIEYINQTELYINCNKEKKIYSYKRSLFETMEDFDLEKLNKIKNQLFSILDDCFSFENFITNYFYERYSLNQYKTFSNLTLIMDKLTNDIKQFINQYMDKFNDYYSEKVGSKIANIFDNLYNLDNPFYSDIIKENIDNSLNLLDNFKNKLFNKYYKNKYSEMQKLYIDLIQNLTVITPSLNLTLINFFDEIQNEQNKYSTENWENNIDEKISLYYSNVFPEKLITNYFNFIKENITKAYDIPYFEENINTIINIAESKISNSTLVSDLVNEILKNDYKNYGFDITIDNYGENNNIEEIKNILVKFHTSEYNEKELEVMEQVNILKNNFLSEINLKSEEFDKDNKIISYINNTIYATYKLNNTFYILINEFLAANINITDYIKNMPNFMGKAYNMSIDYYKGIYNRIINYYKKIISISNEFPLYEEDLVENKFGELGGYALIDGLDHLDPVCKNGDCPYKIDMESLKNEVRRNRRLSENNFTKEINHINNLLKEMKDIIHDMPYIEDTQDIQNNETERMRKLTILKFNSIFSIIQSLFGIKIYDECERYTSSSPAKDKKNIEAILPNLNNIADSFNNFIYKTAKQFDNDIEVKFTDELNNFETIYLNYLYNLKNKLQEKDYINVNYYLTSYYQKINNYVNNMTNSIVTLSKAYLDIIENKYIGNQITGTMVTNKIILYYDVLDKVISNKYKVIDEKEYKAYKSLLRRNEESKFEKLLTSVKEALTIVIYKNGETGKEIAFDFLKEDENEPEIMKQEIEYDWDDKDSYDEEIDDDDKKSNLMYKSSKAIQKKKEKEAKKEAEKKTKESEFSKKTKEIKKALDDAHVKAETEITFDLSKKQFDIKTNLAWDYDKTIKAGWQFPFGLPAIPIIQFRIGIKFAIYFRIVIGVKINFQYKDGETDFDIIPNIGLTVGVKLDITAEVGAYAGFINVYAGIQGTLLDAKAEVKLEQYQLKGYSDFYSGITISALQFRVYAEVEIKVELVFWTIRYKKTFFDQSYGLTKPLLSLYYYVRLSKDGQVLDEKKDASSLGRQLFG